MLVIFSHPEKKKQRETLSTPQYHAELGMHYIDEYLVIFTPPFFNCIVGEGRSHNNTRARRDSFRVYYVLRFITLRMSIFF